MRKTSREWSAALFLLRAVQLGLSIQDLDYISFGMVLDMYTEASNDSVEHVEYATQDDMDDF